MDVMVCFITLRLLMKKFWGYLHSLFSVFFSTWFSKFWVDFMGFWSPLLISDVFHKYIVIHSFLLIFRAENQKADWKFHAHEWDLLTMVFIIWWFSGPLAWGSLISVSIFRILFPPTPGTPCKSTFHFHTWRMYTMFPASWVWSGRRTGQGTRYLSFITSIVTYSPCFNLVPPCIYLERDLLFYPFRNRRPSSSVRAW